MAEARCRRIADCQLGAIERSDGDQATCVERVQRECALATTYPDSGLEVTGATVCADTLPQVSCNDFLHGRVAACRFTGTRPAAAPCATGPQCRSGVCALRPVSP